MIDLLEDLKLGSGSVRLLIDTYLQPAMMHGFSLSGQVLDNDLVGSISTLLNAAR